MFVFFFNDTATTEIYTLSLHDALPISLLLEAGDDGGFEHMIWHRVHLRSGIYMFKGALTNFYLSERFNLDRKSTRLNSSHANISYAVFCLKKKKKIT